MNEARPKPISPILAVNFVGTLGVGIVMPFLVFLVTRLGGNAVVYGLIGATYSAFQLVGAPILGRLSDRVGRKRILLASHFGTLLSWGIFLVALVLPVRELLHVQSSLLGAFTITIPLVVLFLARAMDGLTGGNVSVANAYLADITTEADRSANFGRMAASSNLGFILGPALAGVLGATAAGERLPVLAAALISAIAMVIIATGLREADPCILSSEQEPEDVRKVLGGDHKPCYRLQAAPRLSVTEVLALPDVGLLIGLQLLVYLGFNLYYVAFPVYASVDLAWPLSRLGLYFTFMSGLMVLVQGPVLKRLSRRFGDRDLAIVGSLVLAVGFAALSSPRTAIILAGTTLLALGNGLMWPSLLAALSRASDRSVQGAVQGLASSAAAGASILGLLAGGLLYDRLGGRVFLLSASVTAVVFLLAFRVPISPSSRHDLASPNRR